MPVNRKKQTGFTIAGFCAGAINGLFGAGGGMVLVPLLTALTDLTDEEIFPASISIILPICLVSLVLRARQGALPWAEAWPYLLGSAGGGALTGWLGRRIPTQWLHRVLGVLILWGGVRYLC
jgi:uncharacterized membrane protein YfcA